MRLVFNRLASLLISVCVVIASQLIFIAATEAVTQNFQWNGTTGYRVEGTLSYDKTIDNRVVSEKGAGLMKQLNSLQVKVYNPDDEVIGEYDNVVDGKSQNDYFELNLDPESNKIVGNIDLGGAEPGELYLKGTVDGQLSLIEIKPSGKEHSVDRDF